MQRNIKSKGFDPPKPITTLIDRLASKLEKNIETFSPDAVHLRLMLEYNSARKLYTASLALDVPGKTIAAKEEQHDLQAAVRAAFDDVEGQLKKYKVNLRKEYLKRRERRKDAA